MSGKLSLSFEFFPPRTPAALEKLLAVARQLSARQPEFFSVTYGAGGSTREYTMETALGLREAGFPVAPHLSSQGDEAALYASLDRYREAGITRLVVLRGDQPSGAGSGRRVHAAQLVGMIRAHSGDFFQLEVAAYPEMHPEAGNFSADLRWLKAKLDAGAQRAITQFFFNADAYFYFRDACLRAGITQPIIPGIMPIRNQEALERFAGNCGAEIPRWLHYRLLDYGSDEKGLQEFAREFVGSMCRRLLEGGAPGLHFYTLNHAHPSYELATVVPP